MKEVGKAARRKIENSYTFTANSEKYYTFLNK